MNNFVKMDVAIEIMADKISKVSNLYFQTDNLKYKSELDDLIAERNNIYNGDIYTINKVIEIYGNELKYNFNGE